MCATFTGFFVEAKSQKEDKKSVLFAEKWTGAEKIEFLDFKVILNKIILFKSIMFVNLSKKQKPASPLRQQFVLTKRFSNLWRESEKSIAN